MDTKTTKTAKPMIDEEVATKTAKPAIDEEVDLWKIKRKVRLPRASAGEAASQYFAVNGVPWMIPRGKEVEVPEPIARNVDNWLKNLDAVEDTRREIPNKI